MKPDPRVLGRKVKGVLLQLDDGKWFEIEGVQDVRVQTGSFRMNNGAMEAGHCATISLEVVQFDDGQAALDAALNVQGVLTIQVVGYQVLFEGEFRPFKVVARKGKSYDVVGRFDILRKVRAQ